MIILPLTIDFKIVSNVFFGVAIFSMILIIVAWVGNKKTDYKDLKDREHSMSDDVVMSYIHNLKKVNNDDRKNAHKKRAVLQVSFSVTVTVFSGVIALIFAFI